MSDLKEVMTVVHCIEVHGFGILTISMYAKRNTTSKKLDPFPFHIGALEKSRYQVTVRANITSKIIPFH